MKKLMIAAAIVCAAAISQAATATWSTGTCYFGGEDTALKDKKQGGVTQPKLGAESTVYLWTGISLANYNALTLLGSEGIYKAFDAKTGKLTIGGAATAATESGVFTDGKHTFTYSPDLASGVSDYCAVIVTYEDGDDTFYSANTIAPTGTDMTIDGASKLATYWGASGTGSATTWYKAEAVPEPFSGALALLGMGCIALRRKMKKAKKA